MPLTAKQQRFVDEYLVDLNATQAAIRAGYSEKTAFAIGAENLRKPKIAEVIASAQAERARRTELTQDMVVAELRKLAFANLDDFTEIDDAGNLVPKLKGTTRSQKAALTEVTIEEYIEGRGDGAKEVKRTKIKLADKRGPLVDLGKHLGMWPTKVALGGAPDLPPVQTETAVRDYSDLIRGALAKQRGGDVSSEQAK